MTMSFPLARSAFYDLLPIRSAPFKLLRFEEATRTAGGAYLTRELADPRWTVAVELVPMPASEEARIMALLEAHGHTRPFWMGDPMHPGPQLDLKGTLLGAATPTVSAADAQSLRIAGLPNGYKFSVGDRLSVSLPGGDKGYHRVLEAATAATGGTTGWFQVDPPPREGTAAGQGVQLTPAVARMQVVPGSLREGAYHRTLRAGVGFDAVEV